MERADMEIQIIHRDKFGLTIGISVLVGISPSTGNDFLTNAGFIDDVNLETLGRGQNRYLQSEKVDLSSLVRDAFDYIKYEGSLTTPPCSQRVTWFVLNKRVEVLL